MTLGELLEIGDNITYKYSGYCVVGFIGAGHLGGCIENQVTVRGNKYSLCVDACIGAK